MNTGSGRQVAKPAKRAVRLMAGSVALEGEWCVPAGAVGIVLFAHGSGSSRHSPRNQAVARALQEAGTGTLLFDLLTREEEVEDARTGHLRFDIGLLARRLRSIGLRHRAVAVRKRRWNRQSMRPRAVHIAVHC